MTRNPSASELTIRSLDRVIRSPYRILGLPGRASRAEIHDAAAARLLTLRDYKRRPPISSKSRSSWIPVDVSLPWIDEDHETVLFVGYWFGQSKNDGLRHLCRVPAGRVGLVADALCRHYRLVAEREARLAVLLAELGKVATVA